MPTAAKSVAALLFAALAWLVSEQMIPFLPEGMGVSRFSLVNAAIGFVLGWSISGHRVGLGYIDSIGIGLTTAGSLFITAVFLHSFIQMIEKSMNKLYDGPAEALVSVFEIALKNAAMVSHLTPLLILIIGGAVAGLITEFTSYRAS
ncbi:MAG: TrgA family protein [Rhodobacteraceae bacterium]|nr:TrgA family protein [Paracoccaceae bacterium]